MQIWSVEIKELETLYTSLKGQLPDLEKELEQLIETKDANVILIYSRRCLEVIITDLCENELKRPRKTEPLKGIIDKLGHEEKVPSHIIVSMQYLNSLSTFGAHPKDFDPEQIKPVLNNLIIIIKWYLKYKTEKAELVRNEKVTEHTDERSADIKEPIHIHKSRKRPFIIVSGILIVAIILFFVFDPFNFFRKDKFEDLRDPNGKISIAVMPFENQTGDTTLNWFQRGISSLIINGLGNSSELAVLDDHTMFEVMESMNQVYTAGISPSIAKEVAKKVKAETYISGSFQGREDAYWILVNLVNTESGEIIWTNKVEGNLKSSSYLDLADSLCNEIKNYLEIKALENVADFDFREAYPNSAEAYRYFIEGMNLILAEDYEPAIQSLKKALEIDSTFTFASFYIAFAYNYSSQFEECVLWTEKAYNSKNRLPYKYQPLLEIWYACSISKNLSDIIRYCRQFEESGIQSRLLWFDLGTTYISYPVQFEKAVAAFDKVMQMSLERGGYWEYDNFYNWYVWALHNVGQHEKEKEICDIGLSINHGNFYCISQQVICCLFRGDSLAAEKNIKKLKSMVKEDYNWSESKIELWMGHLYLNATDSIEAEKHYRNAYNLDDTDISYMLNLAKVLINAEININEGMELVQKALIIDPENNWADWLKGRGLYKQGKFEEAVILLRRAKGNWLSFHPELHHDVQEAEQALANKNK
jgi:TolB-like protein/Tfp pilus assembly protein PilF